MKRAEESNVYRKSANLTTHCDNPKFYRYCSMIYPALRITSAYHADFYDHVSHQISDSSEGMLFYLLLNTDISDKIKLDKNVIVLIKELWVNIIKAIVSSFDELVPGETLKDKVQKVQRAEWRSKIWSIWNDAQNTATSYQLHPKCLSVFSITQWQPKHGNNNRWFRIDKCCEQSQS